MKRTLICSAIFLAITSARAQVPAVSVSAAAALSSTETTALPVDTGKRSSTVGEASSLGSRSDTDTLHSESTPQQTKRILGIVPNFRSVNADTALPRQSSKEKIKIGLEDSFDYSSFIFAGMQAAISQGTKAYPAFHQGAAGYGRYYWHTIADQTDENLWVESLLPSVLHEDSRYYTLGHGGLLKRASYAFSRALVTRNDNGSTTFNSAEIVGAGAAAGISSAYYPNQYCTWTKTGQRWLTSIVLDSATFAVKEFWPDVNRAVFHRGN
jgi:hypothetical protein